MGVHSGSAERAPSGDRRTGARETLSTLARTATAGGAEELGGTLDTAARRLAEPMRLAVAGQLKRGKSTLVNALLGEEVVAVGQLETTFNVTEFHHAARPRLTVHYKGDRPPREVSPDELARLSVRDAASLDTLRGIRKLEAGWPNELLKAFHLVDTPGLASVHRTDAANAAAFLGIQDPAAQEESQEVLDAIGRDAQEVHDDSVAELDRADAVLFLFTRALGRADIQVAEEFVGAHQSAVNGLRAFGVLTRCDQFWPPSADLPGQPDPLEYDPLDAGREIVAGYLGRPALRAAFHTVLPVAGLTGLGAQTLTDDEYVSLVKLADSDAQVLVNRLRSERRFARQPYEDLPVPPEERARLLHRLGAWGVHRACVLIRRGADLDGVRGTLLADSGVAALRDLIVEHFGNRSGLIKLDSALRLATASVHRSRALPRDRTHGFAFAETVNTVGAALERFRLSDPGPAEIALLTGLYRGDFDFTDAERDEVLLVTGERGRSARARLGLATDAPLSAFRTALADRRAAWRVRVDDPFHAPPTVLAARTVLRTYDRIADRVASAERLLFHDTD
ncbi:dynamin family protein [Streptomyces sp. NPDC050844]|uniref:dynamin family protein n=1 Tax=Streptomyces sp. NPDC050844 TaxID=3155790 RepID=UPI0033F3A5AA